MVAIRSCSLGVVYVGSRSNVVAGDALLLRIALQEQKEPSPQELAFLQEWMKRPTMGGIYLYGLDRHVWDNPVPADLIALKPRQKNGIFSS